MFNFKHPALSAERLAVYAALGYYAYREWSLAKQKSGNFAGPDEWMVKVDKDKMFEMAEKQFKLNPIQRTIMEQLFNGLMEKKGE